MTVDTNVRMNDTYIDSLSRSISGVRAAGNVPSLVKTVINGEMWRYRIVKQTKQVAGFGTFRQFVEAPAPDGLGTTPDTLASICRFAGDTEAAQAVAQAAGIPAGGSNDKLTTATKLLRQRLRSVTTQLDMLLSDSTASDERRLINEGWVQALSVEQAFLTDLLARLEQQ